MGLWRDERVKDKDKASTPDILVIPSTDNA